MASFCIPPQFVEKLKASKELLSDVNVAKLKDMSSKEIEKFFSDRTTPELGKFITTKFEKAVISADQNAITDWAKSVFKPSTKLDADIARLAKLRELKNPNDTQKLQIKRLARSTAKNDTYLAIIDRVHDMEDMGIMDGAAKKALYLDIAADKLGVTVSADEIAQISKKAAVIDKASQDIAGDLGNPMKLKENLEFFKAKKDMDDYLESLNPSSNLRIATGTIGRGMMLASIKSPILNIGSNTELAITEALSRRLANLSYKGADNNLARQYVKNINIIYQKTGYDLSRMTSLADSGSSGARVLGDDRVHTQGKGVVKKVGRVVENIVFKQLMGAPDVVFAAAHFADSVNLQSLKIAKGDKRLASAVMEDAMRIQPRTPAGELIREQGRLDAEVATWTNKSWATKVSEGFRGIVNELTGDLRLGDLLFPFVKTPANVIATGADYAGVGAIKALAKTIKSFKTGQFGTKEHLQSISTDLVRSGLGILAAASIASQFDDDDFVGAYDPNRAQIGELKNSVENSLRIGGKWVSMDWFGPLSVPLTAMLFARKYGNKPSEQAFQYAKGVGSSVFNLPGISDFAEYTRSQLFKKDQKLEEMSGDASDYLTKQIYSRLTPSIISDLAKATDQYEREGGKGFAGIKTKIPGLRQTADAKQNVFGENIKAEPAWSTILFGSRIKTSRDNAITKEISRVAEVTDKNINFTDWDKSSAAKLSQFKAFVGEDKFKEAKKKYGSELKKSIDAMFKDSRYKVLDDSEKLRYIQNRDSTVQDKVFDSYGFKPDKTKSKESIDF